MIVIIIIIDLFSPRASVGQHVPAAKRDWGSGRNRSEPVRRDWNIPIERERWVYRLVGVNKKADWKTLALKIGLFGPTLEPIKGPIQQILFTGNQLTSWVGCSASDRSASFSLGVDGGGAHHWWGPQTRISSVKCVGSKVGRKPNPFPKDSSFPREFSDRLRDQKYSPC